MKDHDKETCHNPRLTVQLLGSGYAAVELVDVHIDGKFAYIDVWNTGFGRYKTFNEAEIEAKQWSESDEIPYGN